MGHVKEVVCLVLGVFLLTSQVSIQWMTTKPVSWYIVIAGLTCLGLIPAFWSDNKRVNSEHHHAAP
jgi:hypothetical protein